FVGVWERTTGRGHSVGSDRGPAGSGNGSSEELVAIMSMPVLSTPKKKSRPSGKRVRGMIGVPMGTLPGGTIFKNRGGPGRAEVIGRLTAELSQVLRMVRFEAEFPPASKANDPVELKAIEV